MHKKFKRLPSDMLAGLLGFAAFALLLLSLKNPTSLDDGLRHFAMATAMRERGIFVVPGWSIFLSHGYLSTLQVDPWFLSDVLLIPFTRLPLALGLHLFVILELALLITAWLLVLRALEVHGKAGVLFVVLLLCGNLQFTGRFLFARPYALMTAMVLFTLWCILERRWIMGTAILALSVLLSQLFVFPFFLSVCAFVAFLVGRDVRSASWLSAMSIAGLALGMALHPHALNYVTYLVDAFVRIPFHHSVGLSPEMQTGFIDPAFVSILLAWAWIVLSLAVIVRAQKIRSFLSKQTPSVLLFIICVLLTFFYVFWLRALDVLWPLLLALAAAAYVINPSVPRSVVAVLLPKEDVKARSLIAIVFVFCVMQVCTLPYSMMRDDASRSLSRYAAIDAIPHDNSVLNLDWDLFFAFVAVRPDLHYATGIDPTFTYLTDPDITDRILALQRTKDALSDDERLADVQAILAAYPSDDLVLSQRAFHPVIAALEKQRTFPVLAASDAMVVFSVPKIPQ